jgi:hypothetical protein
MGDETRSTKHHVASLQGAPDGGVDYCLAESLWGFAETHVIDRRLEVFWRNVFGQNISDPVVVFDELDSFARGHVYLLVLLNVFVNARRKAVISLRSQPPLRIGN